MIDGKAQLLTIDGAPANPYVLRPLPEPVGQPLLVARSREQVLLIDLHRVEAARAEEARARTLAEEQLHGAEAQLRKLTTRLTAIREEERVRMAREIHDELGQALTGLKMDVACLEKQFCDKHHPARALIQRMRKLIDSTVHVAQRISTGMRPDMLDELGLACALRWQARQFEKRTGIRCRPKLPAQALNLDAELSTALFRAFQEILTNVARHARANSVRACLQTANGGLLLEVTDDGIGISEDKIRHRDSLGLLGMRERAQFLGGEVTISCKPGCGTTVRVSIPLHVAPLRFELARVPLRDSEAVACVIPMFGSAQSIAH